jgi:hypothetical protein
MKSCIHQNHATLQLELQKQFMYTAIVQLSPWINGELINNLPHQKLVNYIIVASELKMGFLYDNFYALYIHL